MAAAEEIEPREDLMRFDDEKADSKGVELEEVPPEPKGGEIAVKEMKKKATFSALEDEIRVICLPHLNIHSSP